MKKFFGTITYEKENGAGGKRLYEIDKSCCFKYDKPTCNPIFPFIYNHAAEGEEIGVYLIQYPDSASLVHTQTFLYELGELKREVGFEPTTISVLDAPLQSDNAALIEFSKDLINQIEDGDILFADISNGERILALPHWMMLNCALKARRNIELGALSCASLYERPSRTGAIGIIRAHTSIFAMNNIITNVSKTDGDPDALIKRLLGNLAAEEVFTE